ncbi:MAG: sigma-70 family RNA polymerase sigma factor [Planctomycetes bacterium]|nr:sigma-70 family RNA polymerase sigma factor [Planctomycetota bacterium]
MGRQARRIAESGDFVQHAYSEILEKQLEVQDDEHLVKLATRIAHNRIRDALRRNREVVGGDLSDSLAASEPGSPDPTPSVEVCRRESLEELIGSLETLPLEYRRVLELRSVDGMAFDAVAEAMGRSPNAVQKLHQRAMIALGAALRRQNSAQ